jgi:hypothetical protein
MKLFLLLCFSECFLAIGLVFAMLANLKMSKRLQQSEREILNLYEEIARKNREILCIEKRVYRMEEEMYFIIREYYKRAGTDNFKD